MYNFEYYGINQNLDFFDEDNHFYGIYNNLYNSEPNELNQLIDKEEINKKHKASINHLFINNLISLYYKGRKYLDGKIKNYFKEAMKNIECMYNCLEFNFYKYISIDYISSELRAVSKKTSINLQRLEDILYAKNRIKEGLLRNIFERLYKDDVMEDKERASDLIEILFERTGDKYFYKSLGEDKKYILNSLYSLIKGDPFTVKEVFEDLKNLSSKEIKERLQILLAFSQSLQTYQ